MTVSDRIEYASRQFEIHKTYAMYWQAKAMIGGEKEKALEVMKRHIHYMVECNDTIAELRTKEDRDDLRELETMNPYNGDY